MKSTTDIYKPDFILIGAMKCATSTLHEQLSLHESFFMTTPKEPSFFSDIENYDKGSIWYQSFFKKAGHGQVKGESSTNYSKLPNYPETVNRIKSFCPEIKCIYLMRHPVDRLISHYIHEWSQGNISCDINTAVRHHPELIEYGRYNMQLEPYISTFGFSAILPLFTERLQITPRQELQAIFDFLEIPAKPEWCHDIQSNKSSERLKVCAWRDALVNDPTLRFFRRAFIPKSVRRKVRRIWTMTERPMLSDGVLRHVEQIFDEDLELLGRKVGVELNCRNFKQSVTSATSSHSWITVRT
ncbi:sulfotransferase domain-containing protein [Desulfopila inferna]|uniref:sulfotransferase domain-containing protein n=1 Tax=Desulfopila inferna TaxID=468528 RepID=UPI001963380D|nr:sulfotransferase domain-containing protein [Desulfopila inferna]MBM9605760.1 sulfotransferase domain-containing protein [Desulfopila inferna]